MAEHIDRTAGMEVEAGAEPFSYMAFRFLAAAGAGLLQTLLFFPSLRLFRASGYLMLHGLARRSVSIWVRLQAVYDLFFAFAVKQSR
jgi:hypothetical protein